MNKTNSRAAQNPFRVVYSIISLILLMVYLSTSIKAQGSTDGTTPLGLTAGSPTGTYPLSDFDVVNLYNGTLNFRLPIYEIAGRGGAAYPITLQVEKKWTVYRHFEPGIGYFYYADGAWWSESATAWFLDVGRVEIRTGYREQPTGFPVEGLTRVTFTAPDGTEYEFRDQSTNGQPKAPVSGGFNRGTIFVTADGTTATFISDWNIHEAAYGLEPPLADGYVSLKDGTHFRVDDGTVTWMRDRNGNKVNFGYDTFRRVTSITDSLNRLVTITYPSTTTGFTQVSFKGYGGVARTLKVGQTNLANALRSGYSMLTGSQLFPEMHGVWNLDAKVINYIELPDGRSYQLRYNPFGELARVVLPTGGAFEYDYAAGLTNGAASGVFSHSFPPTEKYVYRRLTERRVYPDGGSGSAYESKTTYSRPETTTTNLGYVITEQRNNSGTLLTKSQHYFHGSARASFLLRPTHYPAWRDGREYKTEIFHTDGSTILKRIEHTYAQRASVSWWGGTSDTAPPNDPRTIETVTTLEPATANLVSKQTFGFDDAVPFNNQNNVKEYYFGSGAAGSLARETRTTFVTSSSYTDNSVHLRGLPSQVSIHDGAGTERSRTVYEYDNYTTDSNHAGLNNRSNISGFDSSFSTSYTTRGNATATTRYFLLSGSATGSISTYSQYDIAGNVVKTIDGRGYASEFHYTDCFGTPNGEAQISTDPIELGSVTKSFAYVTQVKNALNQWIYAQFDYYLGRVVDAKDVNGIVASGYYDDLLDRPTQIKRAVGTSAASQTLFGYDDDADRTITITSDLNTDTDGLLINKLLYDQMGRTIETRQYEGGGNYISTKTQYDVLGRAYKNSNPFRPLQSESELWTTTTFDAMGRVVSVTTPDSAVATTSYSGNSVTATDQAGKARKSVFDALGRLISVYEDPSGVNYETTYTYDVLNNMTNVTQGVQTRTFVYDSLGRLTSTTNPESGTVGYTHDNNGNVLTRVDARSVTATTAYDALNRPTSRSYNDTPQTPTVNYFYDAQTLPSGAPSFDRGSSTGRLVAVTYAGASEGTYRGYDQMGRVVRQYQRTDSINYLVEATYYANGSLDDVTYPAVPGAGDRRVISYTNDYAGRLASLSSSATSYAPAASVSTIGYASNNGLKTETYGNGLIHAINYNNRLQPSEIKLGTSGTPTSVVGLTYNYGTTTNNGNVLSISYSGGGLSYTQSFGYDALNRLTTSQETNGGTSWSQTNGYDRYGNRWVNLGGGIQSLYFTASSNRITGGSYDSAGNLLNDGLHAYTFNGDNMIRTVDSQSAYVYDGEGRRVRKLLGENLRFIYGIGGKLVAEFAASGALRKEYVYGASGLVATIEPTALNSNGTRYSTPDHLGSPRVLTNSSAGVVSRHDYMPFGEELGTGIGGRSVGMGFSVADGLRQKFTSYERDSETSLDFAEARFYSSGQGRFTSVDPLMASAITADPQTFNRYTYVLNAPLALVDPTGMFGICPGGGQGGQGGMPLGSFSLNEQTTDEPEQKQTQQQAQQPEPPKLTATVTVPPVEFEFNLSLNTEDPSKGPFFTGFGSILEITLYEDGKPVAGATGTEKVTGTKGERIEQNPRNVTTNAQGQTFDLVGRGPRTEEKVNLATAREVWDENALKPVDVTTEQQITLKLPSGGSAQITFQRRITNLDDQRNIRPAPAVRKTGPTPNYTVTTTQPVVKRLP